VLLNDAGRVLIVCHGKFRLNFYHNPADSLPQSSSQMGMVGELVDNTILKSANKRGRTRLTIYQHS